MLYQNELTLPNSLKDLSFASVEYYGRATIGAYVLQLAEDVEKVGSVYLPGEVASKERIDVGRCLESGRLFAFRPYTGIWVKNPSWVVGAHEVHVHVKGCKGVLAEMLEGGRLKMLGRQVLIARQPKRTEVNGIALPDEAARYTGIAKVLEVGPDVQDVQVGDTVLAFESSSLIPVRLGAEIGQFYGVEARDLGILEETAIGVIEAK